MNDNNLPEDVARGLSDFVDAAREKLGPELESIILFGSAAEGRLRATSDVNMMLVLRRFDVERIDALRDALRTARALIRLEAMFILRCELPAAAEAFAVKFADMRTRYKVLWGDDPLTAVEPSRSAMLTRLQQILLNFILRTRERYALVSLREEQLTAVVADAAGPLRSAAALILALEGHPAESPKAALDSLAPDHRDALADISRARESGSLPPGSGRTSVLALIEIAQSLRDRASKLM